MVYSSFKMLPRKNTHTCQNLAVKKREVVWSVGKWPTPLRHLNSKLKVKKIKNQKIKHCKNNQKSTFKMYIKKITSLWETV